MTSLQIAALAGEPRQVSAETVDAFAKSLEGSLIHPDDDGYADAISLWNGMIKKRPAVVIRPAGTPDVVRTVDFVRDHELELSIKGAGHNIAGLALTDGGITLDMSGLKGVVVDIERQVARVAPGCTLGDVDRATQEHGLATTLGFVSATGVAGLTLGGGFGYLTRRFGWTVDDLEEVEIVTADGVVRRASRTENEDLFWALRGGGGNFGVATEFVFRLHEVGPQVTSGVIAWPAVGGRWRPGPLPNRRRGRPARADGRGRAAQRAPGALAARGSARHADHHAGRLPLGDDRAGGGRPRADQVAWRAAGRHAPGRDYVAQQSLLDATQPKGMHFYWKSEFLSGLSDELFETYNAQFVDLKAPANQIVLFHIAGALNEHPEDDGAMGNREAAFACVIQAMWPGDSPAGDANRDWVRTAWQALKPYSTGGNYVNFQTSMRPMSAPSSRIGATTRAWKRSRRSTTRPTCSG